MDLIINKVHLTNWINMGAHEIKSGLTSLGGLPSRLVVQRQYLVILRAHKLVELVEKCYVTI